MKQDSGLWNNLVVAVVGGTIATVVGGIILYQLTSSSSPTLTPTKIAQVTANFTPTNTPTSTPNTPTPHAGEERVIAGAPMVFVPAGDFLMGSSDRDPHAASDEKPQHPVYLDAFWMDRFEVTNALYKKCVDAVKCRAPFSSGSFTRLSYFGNPQYNNYPVITVSWDDANTFCGWVGKRIPTEAEWEKAARGTDGRIYPWGNTFDLGYLNSGKVVGDTTAVDSFSNGASPYDVLDMAGNVWEWVNDWYASNYYAKSTRENPTGPADGKLRVIRGGSWADAPVDVRAATRNQSDPTQRPQHLGFRCAKSFSP